jgi:hypothetical protein
MLTVRRTRWPGLSQGTVSMSEPKVENRFIDLGRKEDLKNLVIRLVGIVDYCRLLRGYQGAAENFQKAQRHARVLHLHGSDLDTSQAWLNACEPYYKALQELQGGATAHAGSICEAESTSVWCSAASLTCRNRLESI